MRYSDSSTPTPSLSWSRERLMDELSRARFREAELRAVIEAARALHVAVPGVTPPECRTCVLFGPDDRAVAAAWPCETAQALGQWTSTAETDYATADWDAITDAITARFDYPIRDSLLAAVARRRGR